MATKYKWIKLKDVLGETYEYEDCEMKETFLTLIIFFKAPVGVVKKMFFKNSLVNFEFIKDTSGKE